MFGLIVKKLVVPVGYELHGEPQEEGGKYTATVYTVRKIEKKRK